MSKWTREKIQIPKSIKPKERKQIAKVVIEHIQARTLAGFDRNNDKFKRYSKDYAEKKGVGRGDVDLILEGEMIDSIELVSEKAGEIVIGYKKPSSELAGKVEGNRRGTYGQESAVVKGGRDFLGITEDDLSILIDAYQDFSEEDQLTQEEIDQLARELTGELLSDT